MALTQSIENSVKSLMKEALDASSCRAGELRAVLLREADKINCKCEFVGFKGDEDIVFLECPSSVISHFKSACPIGTEEFVVVVKVAASNGKKKKTQWQDPTSVFHPRLTEERERYIEKVKARNLKMYGTTDTEKLNSIAFGQDLAARFANWLVANHFLYYGHRDYCGMGFLFKEGRFYYGEIYDGDFAETQKSFENKEFFIEWLAAQTNNSLSRRNESDTFVHGNQTITRDRLIDAIEQPTD